MVYSQQTAACFNETDVKSKVEEPILGIYQALIEMRVPFEMVHDRLLDADHLAPFKLLILPNIAALSDAQCAQLRDFVARGGRLLATWETSLYDENGEARTDFGLADLFGARYLGSQQGPLKNSYLRLERPTGSQVVHPLLSGFDGAERIINGVHWVAAEPVIPIDEYPLTLIPAYPDLPMEKVYPRVEHTEVPGVYLQRFGKGKVAYFPWDIDRTYWDVLNVDHGRLLWNAIDWALEGEKAVTVTGPGVLDVTVWLQEQSMTVHLVNLTNPMLMKGPIRELIPIGAQKVTLRLPEGKRAAGVHFLVSHDPVRYEEKDGEISLIVPSITDHEVIAIDF